MRRFLLVSALALLCLAPLSGCGFGIGGTSQTPTGIACTPEGSTCYYYLKDGVPTTCNYNGVDACTNTKGGYYNYDSVNGNTYYCDANSHDSCSAVNNAVITPPAKCSAPSDYVYDKLVNQGQAWEVVDQEQSQNTTHEPLQATFTSKKSSTVTMTLSVSVSTKAELSAFASVKAEITGSISMSKTAEFGNDTNVIVPAGQTANGIYGVKVQVTKGHLHDKKPCANRPADYGTVTTYIPVASGWCVWLSSEQDHCPTVS